MKKLSPKMLALVLALLVAGGSIVGGTLAWFTDSVTTGVNTIQAGNLDVAFQMKENNTWVDAEGKTLNFVAADGRENILWEPGCTYQLPAVKIVNKGNLAFEYNLQIAGAAGDTMLADVLEVGQIVEGKFVSMNVTLADMIADPDGAAHGVLLPKDAAVPADQAYVLAGETAEMTLALHMKEEAGNEYQNKIITSISLTAFANQYTYEKDSFDDQYDVNALSHQEQNALDKKNEGYDEVQGKDDFISANNKLNSSDPDADTNEVKLVLTKDIDMSELTEAAVNVPDGKTFVLDLNGYTITGVDKKTSGSTEMFKVEGNMVIEDSAGGGKITVSATTDRGWSAYSAAISNDRGTLTINGGTIEHTGGTDMAYAIDNRSNTGAEPAKLIVNGGNIVSSYIGIRLFANSTKGASDVVINGGVVQGTNKSIWLQSPNANANMASLTVNDGAQLIGDVYVYATGSIENIDVSIVKSAVNGEILDGMTNGVLVENAGVVSVGTTITGGVREEMDKVTGSEPVTITLDSDLFIGTEVFDASWSNGTDYSTKKDGGALFYAAPGTDITFDLGGHTLTLGYTGAEYAVCFYPDNNAKLTVTNGKLVLNDDIVKYCYTCGENAEFIIDESVTIVGTVDHPEDEE